MLLPEATRPGTKDLVRLLLESKASSTSSTYLKEIDKLYSCWQSFRVAIAPPFSASLVLAYLSKVHLISSSHSSVVLVHAALKRFHSLLPVSTLNPALDSAPCQQLLEAAKQLKPPIHKKEPVPPLTIKEIVDKHGSSSASLKDLSIAAICCIGFAGFFRYDELLT